MLVSGTKFADILTGNIGETDYFYVNNFGDQIFNSEGRDVIQAWVDFDMASANAQYLVLMGRGALSATGTAKAEIIAGNSGDNILNGGKGQDRLTGGRGADTFLFNQFGAANSDIIEDFTVAQGDIMALSADAFGVAAGTVIDFVEGTSLGAGPTVFRDATSQLWFDADGSGDGAAVLFANCRAQGLDSTCFAIV